MRFFVAGKHVATANEKIITGRRAVSATHSVRSIAVGTRCLLGNVARAPGDPDK
ncbi:MAG: hypothetical protein RLZZ553_801 [Verrucomicrobiota bacterium]|jgi:hypothetical protein